METATGRIYMLIVRMHVATVVVLMEKYLDCL